MYISILPIGTVITVSDNPYMIIGYAPVDTNKISYDYRVCEWPCGLRGSQETYCLDRKAIQGVVSIGPLDHKAIDCLDKLKQNHWEMFSMASVQNAENRKTAMPEETAAENTRDQL